MPKIRWAGVIKDVARYQEGQLPAGAVKLKMPTTNAKMQISALPFCILAMILPTAGLFFRVFYYGNAAVNFPFIAVGVVGGLLLLPLHELLHAVVYPKQATVTLGFLPPVSMVALCSYPLKRRRFFLMSLLPAVLGILPLICLFAFPASWAVASALAFGFAAAGMISPYPDYYNVFQVLRQVPRGSYVQFSGDDLYYFQSVSEATV